MKKSILLILLLVLFHTASSDDPWKGDNCIIKSEFIWKTGDITAPSCHASTIISTSDGLLAAWFGGTEEGNKDVGIWVSSYINGTWSKPVEAANGIQNKLWRYPCWNPVLYNSGSKVLLFYKVGSSPSTWWGMLMTSDDEGRTWSESVRLPKNILGPVKNKPVLLENDELICPSSTENDGWRVHMEFTSDFGKTWEKTAPINDKATGAIQPTVITHKGGKIQMLCRSTSSHILTSESIDNGYTWSELIPTSLPNPNSGIDAVTLKNGSHLLVYNHLSKGRNMLNVALSDDGTEWKAAVLLEIDMEGTEFSYPAVIQSADGLVHITYTWKRMLIKHVVVDPERIETKQMKNNNWPED
ncbi:MAG: sialidase [Bacteroidetes bacterium GWE2_41_25]|nr:MAG: sialidase [Bacteroidetes bacterium GWA2_40_15]OFX84807.1 MAG: sialidase [Bacteroidetes bacterium GWC2_40_22]OFY12988.1 MAG: sialidase [Bacteroidetes bacterium GWE2_41_25]OFY61177.1 MAG: sialidase [Bacteroidetes bacterium GWF2_41_9]HAM10459.1 sialidase [Bacteroidales bacterium]